MIDGGGDISGQLRQLARAADECGIDTLWVSDHLIQADPTEADMLEAYRTLGFLVGQTERVRLGAMVMMNTGIFASRHLEYVLREFVEHYQETRPDQCLTQRIPRQREPTGASEAGPVQRRDRLGGVLHEYVPNVVWCLDRTS